MSAHELPRFGRVSPNLHPKITPSGELQPGVIDTSIFNASITVMGALATYPSVEVVLSSRDQAGPLIGNLELMRAHTHAKAHGSKTYNPGVMTIASRHFSHPGMVGNDLKIYNELDAFAAGVGGPETRRLLVIDDVDQPRTTKLDRRAMDVKYVQGAADRSDRLGVLLLSLSSNLVMAPIRGALHSEVRIDSDGNGVTKPLDKASAATDRPGNARTRDSDGKISIKDLSEADQKAQQMIDDFRRHLPWVSRVSGV